MVYKYNGKEVTSIDAGSRITGECAGVYIPNERLVAAKCNGCQTLFLIKMAAEFDKLSFKEDISDLYMIATTGKIVCPKCGSDNYVIQ